jgi:maleate isomerase
MTLRARIGYTSVAYVTEIFPKVFYDIVPDGVLLQVLTQQVTSHAPRNMERIHEEAKAAASSFARAGADLVILGGAPTNLSRGRAALNAALQEIADEIGVPVSSSATAQSNALAAVGASKIGVVHPSNPKRDESHDAQMRDDGLETLGIKSAGAIFEDYNRIPADAALRLGRELVAENPDIDTLLYSCPHWMVTHAIEPLERDLGINVVTSLQAITWEGLRKCGIEDRIEGYGRLLHEH